METTETLTQDRPLSAVSSLINHSRQLVYHQREIERETGAHFNLFEILGVSHYEVKTHSSLLAELLNPKGRHGQGSCFLKHFCDLLGASSTFDVDSASVQAEVWLGSRTETSGGRLDILIIDKFNRRIAIENKIYAAEQDNWVRRYRNSLHDEDYLVYLTLNGDAPLQISPDLEEKVIPLSYSVEIIQWLRSCRKDAATVPVVRETLTQYIHLLQTLTHQNISSQMNANLINTVLQTKESFQAYCALHNAYSAVRGKIIRDLGEGMRAHPPAGCNVISVPEGRGSKGESFTFTNPKLDHLGLIASIEFDRADYGNCFYGFRITNFEQPLDKSNQIRNKIVSAATERLGPVQSTGYWPVWKWWTPSANWGNEVFEAIVFDKIQFESELRARIDDLIAIVEATADPAKR